MNQWTFHNGNIYFDGNIVIEGIEKFVTVPLNRGAYIRYTGNEEFYEKEVCIGFLKNADKFNACYKFNSCWYKTKVAERVCEIPFETEFLILKMNWNKYIMLVPIVDRYFKNCIYGEKDERLMLLTMSGSSKVKAKEVNALYMLCGEHPEEMIKTMTRELHDLLGRFSFKNEKKMPDFIRKFGWCTYNAMYDDISHDKILNALKSYEQNSCIPGFIIMDVGWQQTNSYYLSGLEEERKKFPHGLEKTIKEVKSMGVEKYIVWHTFSGYWNGLDTSLRQYDVQAVNWQISGYISKRSGRLKDRGLLNTAGDDYYPSNIINDKAGLPNHDFNKFYNDYYSYIKSTGADGTKIDAMSWMEALAENYGGMVEGMRSLVASAEQASDTFFNGEMICCSGMTNELIFQTLSANILRTCPDFMPERPESHGEHIYTCANTGFWLGEMVTPDWDMFQTGDISGEFHAMARAISGGPVYSTDEVGKENFDIIKKICVNTNQVPLCIEHARICADSLFVDPGKENTAIKIYNKNRFNYVIGAFCCSWQEDTIPAKCNISVKDIYGIQGEYFAAYSYNENKVFCMDRDAEIELDLGRLKGNIYTIAPIIDGVGVIGITDVYNAGGTITAVNAGGTITAVNAGSKYVEVETMCSGNLVIYSENEPHTVFSGKPSRYEYAGKILTIVLEEPGENKVCIRYE